MLLLDDRWAARFLETPESGMGYHIVDIVLKNGTQYLGVRVVGGLIRSVDGLNNVPFGNDDIKDIRFGSRR